MAYFEFLPIHRNNNNGVSNSISMPKSLKEKEQQELVDLADVKLGHEYELVVIDLVDVKLGHEYELVVTTYTVVRIIYAHSPADHTATLERSVVALIANSHQRARAHIGVANHTFAIAFLAELPNGDARLLLAHD
ncbi:unnamed protein product [Linum tenue]|uniref:GH3 middle domain-containing protein n=1 Tax=Linum tenue TaxID=586396 RepID=A0AAV0MCP2_9ROSI|nr:unnamed protein product [Linum tenue]